MAQKDIDRLQIEKDRAYENADYQAADSVPKAQEYLTAVTRLIWMIPQLASHGGSQAEEARFDIKTWHQEKTLVTAWLRSQSPKGGFRLRGMTRMRPRYQQPGGSDVEITSNT